MWGPDYAYGIDVDHTFLILTLMNLGISQISEFLGQQFGVGMNVGILLYYVLLLKHMAFIQEVLA